MEPYSVVAVLAQRYRWALHHFAFDHLAIDSQRGVTTSVLPGLPFSSPLDCRSMRQATVHSMVSIVSAMVFPFNLQELLRM